MARDVNPISRPDVHGANKVDRVAAPSFGAGPPARPLSQPAQTDKSGISDLARQIITSVDARRNGPSSTPSSQTGLDPHFPDLTHFSVSSVHRQVTDSALNALAS